MIRQRIHALSLAWLPVAAMMLLQGCSSAPALPETEVYTPSVPLPQAGASAGSLFQPARALALFNDVKARQVGDTLTVRLAERTQASKSASTDASRDSALTTGNPLLLGGTVTRNGRPILENEWQSSQSFNGRGTSSQSNRLDGNITVTVREVLPNGNLVIQGEKWLTLNQGREFVKVAGVVRPADIGPDNAVPSFKVADANITYSGRGTLADSNRPGLLSRFFLKVWPL
ncbi:MAG: flagellar basal body L-ring protein FlgH [Chromatiales bacterium]|nr:flagellar basal body L-ring protein FlgH [Chromatiales bacterium]